MIRRPPSTNGNASKRAVCPNAVRPTSTAVPPGGSAAIACSIVAGSPIASNTKSGPPSPAASRMPSIVRPGPPGRRGPSASRRATPARSIFARLTSTAMIRRAPASTAPITHDSPTPPRPITATVEPAGTSAVLITAPTPVETPQPISAATSGGTPSGIGTTAVAGTTWAVGDRPDREVGEHGRPVGAGRGASCRRPARGAATASPSTATGARAGTRGRRRHGAYHDRATGRPTRPGSRPGPTASIDARALVAQHDRPRSLPVAVADVEVGVADARRGHPHQHLARPAGRRGAASRWCSARPRAR